MRIESQQTKRVDQVEVNRCRRRKAEGNDE